ncbi:hypothetical protein CKO25_14750 [Thiocapsa imhoffii]|uniref:SAM domain-containing protein n=1 Tax=Thiocapsa imhoffii TaxID=382777 RepID=A0A9X0WJV1_9GAMM|nr:SAM domain-containing protein [Thiocapsa imhoffii]MBK1645883.1 hypothetical protein [Thiocapsa imhoffii]
MTTTTVTAWLEALGLGEYAETFQEQQIDLSVLPSLTEADLKELSVPMGHRKRLLAAIAALGQPAAAPAPAADALDPIIAGLPTPLALPLRDYQQETHPVLKLWAACDAVEILLRVLVFLGIGDLSRRGELPEPLRRELRYPIENPMLGNWRRMAQQVAETLPEGTALPELAPVVRDTLAPFLDGPDASRSVERSFLALRNRLAHGGGISRRLATELLATWQPPFEAIWLHLAWLPEWALVARTEDGFVRLRGPSKTPEPCDPAVPEVFSTILADVGPIVAIRGDQIIPLWPLALFGVPRHPEHGPDPAGQALPQVYVRRGEVNLEYTPLGGATLPQSESDETAVERFLARLGERRVLFLLDGLDEIAERDPRFATDLPLGIQTPTLTWLCAGRPERGLPEAFAAAGALRVFPEGLPPMQAGDIRTLLLERIGPLRKKLLRQDTE